MPLELDSLNKAFATLTAVLAKSNDATLMQRLDEVTRNAVKFGVIHHFEITYGLCWKFMERWIEMNIGPTVADGVTRRELFRLAAGNRLIDDVDQWMRHHDAINQTPHIYQPEVAEEVYAAVPGLAKRGHFRIGERRHYCFGVT